MPIPDYQSIMLPLLKYASDKKEHSIREVIESLANLFKLSEEERKEVCQVASSMSLTIALVGQELI